ncbi:unnamed protein product [Didymodactylos carnosus]|uniref:RRM domain-containing protein n=1 Tax=Didymodactylos carnosus TaxID=1234261 RepID=A0A813SUQ3_9BILA|nr:unnamed protein product [Didymodactylos carnosus]CAF3586138.1 unnamed protein product [Didymodactylos carnosus]
MLAVGNTSYKTSNTSSLPSSVLKGLSSSGQHPSTNPQLSTTLLPPVSSNAVINNNNNIPHSTTHRSQLQQHHHERRRNYRYTGDPASHAADKKAYVNGDPEGTPMHLSGCADPRNPNRNDKAYLELPIPKFKIDRCWVGYLPAKEVTFRNLNDNITKAFLADICNRFGEIDDCRIYYDRVTKKHLGLGTVIFKKTKAARECVKTLHNSTKMGSVISVSLDTGGIDRTKQYATLIRGPEQEKAAAAAAVSLSI